MTWGEFKKAVDVYVKDDEPLVFIDWSADMWDDELVVERRGPDDAVSIT